MTVEQRTQFGRMHFSVCIRYSTREKHSNVLQTCVVGFVEQVLRVSCPWRPLCNIIGVAVGLSNRSALTGAGPAGPTRKNMLPLFLWQLVGKHRVLGPKRY